MAVNKVVCGSEVLVDMTGASVTPETLCEGSTAMNAAGELITGTGLCLTDVTIEEVK